MSRVAHGMLPDAEVAMLDVYWPDSELESVTLEYDEARLVILEETGRRRMVVAAGPIGLEHVGLWDESIIDSGEIVTDHPFAARCWSAVMAASARNGSLRESGSPARNRRSFSTLVVRMIDDTEVIVTAAEFEVREAS